MAVAAGEPDLHQTEGGRRPPPDDDRDAAEQPRLAFARDHSRPRDRDGRVQLVPEALEMRGLKSTIAMFLVLAGLGAYIYFVTWKQTDDKTTKKDPVFAGVESDKIQELKVKAESGEVTTLKKSADKWQIEAP